MEKEVLLKRKYRFQRIKNKKEAAYRVPEFFKRITGVQSMTESGIWYGKETTKIYPLNRDGGQIKHIIGILQSMDTDFAVLKQQVSDATYMIVYCSKNGQAEAAEWFEAMEEKSDLQSLTLEQRLKAYVRFRSELSGTKNEAAIGSYVMEPMKWKDAVGFTDVRWKDGCMEYKDACIKIFAVRQIDAEQGQGIKWLESVGKKAYIKAIATDVKWLSGEEVLQRLHGRYLGLESVLPELKHSNPVLYELLCQPEKGHIDRKDFCMASAYFLIKTADKEELEKESVIFEIRAREQGIFLEELPLQYAGGKKETCDTLSMFAGGGYRQHRYQNLLPVKFESLVSFKG